MKTILVNAAIPTNSWSPFNSRTSFETIGGKDQTTDKFSMYQVAVWGDEGKITLYKIPNDYSTSKYSDVSKQVEYRESFALISYNVSASYGTVDYSAALKGALIGFFEKINSLEKADTYGFAFQGHGGGTSMFEGALKVDDARGFLSGVRDVIGKNLDFLDYSSNCTVASFAFLDSYADLVSNVLATDILAGGYLPGGSSESYVLDSILATPRYNFSNIWSNAGSLSGGLSATLDYFEKSWNYAGKANLTGHDQAAYVFNSANFVAFSKALSESIAAQNLSNLQLGGGAEAWNTLFSRLSNGAELKQLFQAIFADKATTFQVTGGAASSGLLSLGANVTTPLQARIQQPMIGTGHGDDLSGDQRDNVLLGLEGDDRLSGGSGNDDVKGYVGSDSLSGDAGNDTVSGGAGADSLAGGEGDDRLLGGDDNDSISDSDGKNFVRGEGGDDRISGGSGFDDINGNQGNDTASGGLGDDWVVGGRDNDLLFGEAGNDIVYGNLGNDTVVGGDAADWVRGGQGDDSVSGGAGDDLIFGDRGNDTISGGAGADEFRSFGEAGIDRLVDFNRAEGDRVVLDSGTSYSVAQAGADVVVSMSGGGQVILVGVSLADLAPGWIVA